MVAKSCPLLLAGLMANPKVADKDGILRRSAEKEADCGDFCAWFTGSSCFVMALQAPSTAGREEE